MGRRDFIRDLNVASEHPPTASIGNLQMDEDGESFSFQYNHGLDRITTFKALMTDNACYPRDNAYFLSADNASIHLALQEIQGSLEGLTIQGLIQKVSGVIDSLSDGDGTAHSPVVINTPPGSPNVYSQSSNGSGADDSEEDDDEDEDEYLNNIMFGTDTGADRGGNVGVSDEQKRQMDPEFAARLNKRIVQDLKHLKLAGYRVGVLQGMRADSVSSLLSISLRVAKLGLSDEVLQAWNLERHQYIVLLIHYSNGYVTFEDVLEKSSSAVENQVTFRMGVNNRYKPTLEEAIAAFSAVKRSSFDTFKPGHRRGGSNARPSSPTNGSRSRSGSPIKGSFSSSKKRFAEEEAGRDIDPGFRLCFISSPMRELMDKFSFFRLVKTRHIHNCGWEGATNFVREQKHLTQMAEAHEFVHFEETPSKKVLPDIVTADHLTDGGDTISMPLTAMQFVMLRLMRCTEFCLVCHKRTEESFEAIKPYVCSDPLCLFQYMNLGFGPSIEHEILTQPYVVDLLISFCYAGASADRLRGYPDGMGLRVPPPPPHIADQLAVQYPDNYPSSDNSIKPIGAALPGQFAEEWAKTKIPVHLGISRRLIELDRGNVLPDLKTGQWVQLTYVDPTAGPGMKTMHYRVEKYLHPFIHIADGLGPKKPKLGTSPTLFAGTGNAVPPPAMSTTDMSGPPKKEATSLLAQTGTMSLYTLKFDDLIGPLKAAIIIELLSTLPSVCEMAEYLSHHGASEASIMGWAERVSEPALGLLRWIVASNRSCIVQVDQAPGQTATEAASLGVRLEQKLTGLNDWMQFRFAQGAPDKEDKFHKALETKKDVTGRFPSMFAWHGSSLGNWHSIIRHGLDFNDTLNGRAFGHGVYCSSDFCTSLGYSSGRVHGQAYGRPTHWPQSSLFVQQAICLNEIVNAPSEFVSHNPHLVIQFTEWIQCRYLLVQAAGAGEMDDKMNAAQLSVTKTGTGAQSVVQAYSVAMHQNKIEKKDPSGPFIVQDPNKFITNGGRRIQIPRSSFPASRNFMSSSDGKDPSTVQSVSGTPGAFTADGEDPTPRKKRKSPNGKTLSLPNKGKTNFSKEDISDDSDLEDIAFFLEEEQAKSVPQSLSGLGVIDGKASGKAKGPITHDENGKPLTDFVPGSLDRSTIQQLAPPPYGTSQGNRRLGQDLKALLSVQNSTPLHELGWYIDGDSISNLYQWIIELHTFPADLPLAKDMQKVDMKSIVLEIRFGPTYPMEPPFVRVIRPRFLDFQSGGGGHVTAGGALCMELLTNSGWSAVSTIESVLLQVRMSIMSTDPKPARLMSVAMGNGNRLGYGGGDYNVQEAIAAYERACNTHGWKFPDMRSAGGEEILPTPPSGGSGTGGDGANDRYAAGALLSSMDKRKAGMIGANTLI